MDRLTAGKENRRMPIDEQDRRGMAKEAKLSHGTKKRNGTELD